MSPTTQSPRPIAPPSASPSPPPRRRSAAAVTIGLALVGVGVVALLSTLGIELPVRVLGSVLLMVLGVGVIVSAVTGEPDGAVLGFSIVLGVLLAIGAVAGAFLDVPLQGGVGDRTYRPSAADLEDEYRLLVGSLVVDLRDLELGPGTTEVVASTVLGQVEVRLPADVPVAVDTGVGGGTATVLGTVEDGLGVDNDQQTEGYENADRRLAVRVDAGLGEVRVTR